MNKPPRHLSRANFLKFLAASVTAVAGGYALFEYPPWPNYDERASRVRRPFASTSSNALQMVELIRYATLAANGHNTQPWKFAVQPNAIEIHPDFARRLPAVDPSDRELWISLGCALENLIIAASAVGYRPEVTYPDATDVIHIRLTPDTPRPSSLLAAIPLRQNTRSRYNGRLVELDGIRQLQALPVEPGVSIEFVLTPTGLKTVLEYVSQGNLSQYANREFLTELTHWLRFDKREALASLDGLYTRCSGNPTLPRWLGRILLAASKPPQQADAARLRTSAGAAVVASQSDGKAAWVRSGQVYQRLALKMTSLNIKSAFLNQPIEVAALRAQFQSALGLRDNLPQLLVRFGYADAMPYSLRRPVEQVRL